jgi:hypothetical protein
MPVAVYEPTALNDNHYCLALHLRAVVLQAYERDKRSECQLLDIHLARCSLDNPDTAFLRIGVNTDIHVSHSFQNDL